MGYIRLIIYLTGISYVDDLITGLRSLFEENAKLREAVVMRGFLIGDLAEAEKKTVVTELKARQYTSYEETNSQIRLRPPNDEIEPLLSIVSDLFGATDTVNILLEKPLVLEVESLSEEQETLLREHINPDIATLEIVRPQEPQTYILSVFISDHKTGEPLSDLSVDARIFQSGGVILDDWTTTSSEQGQADIHFNSEIFEKAQANKRIDVSFSIKHGQEALKKVPKFEGLLPTNQTFNMSVVQPKTCKVYGTCTNQETGAPLSHTALDYHIITVGTSLDRGGTFTDALGQYTVTYTSDIRANLNDSDRVDIIFRVYLGDQPSIDQPILRGLREEDTRFDFAVRPTVDAPVDGPFVVEGMVNDSSERPLVDVTVLLVDIDIRGIPIFEDIASQEAVGQANGLEVLGEAQTDDQGRYHIAFRESAFGRNEGGLADVVAYALDEEKNIVGHSRLGKKQEYLDGWQLINLDISLADDVSLAASEYALLSRACETFLVEAELSLAEIADSSEQIAFLAEEVEQPQEWVELLVQADVLRNGLSQTSLNRAVFYCLVRHGLPTDRRQLLASKPSAQRQAFEAGLAAHTVTENELKVSIKAILDRLHAAGIDDSFEAPDPDIDAALPLGQIVGTTSLTEGMQKEFVSFTLQYEGAQHSFWTELENWPGFNKDTVSEVIQESQFAMQSAVLTFNHLPTLQVLQQVKTDEAWASIRDFVGYVAVDGGAKLAENLKDNQFSPPNGFSDTQSYVQGIARQIESVFPTAVVGFHLQADQDPSRSEIGRLILNDPDLNLGRAHIDTYIDAQVDSGTIKPDRRDHVADMLKQSQRLFNLSPTEGRFETMEVLRNVDLHSALAVAGTMDEATFASRYGSAFKDAFGEEAETRCQSVHQRAREILAHTIMLRSMYGNDYNSVTPAVIAGNSLTATDAESALAVSATDEAPTPNIANLEALFGSLSFCECEHCRSALSPAAYLVDIIQFLEGIDSKIDHPISEKSGRPRRKTARELLFDRRPDLGEIELSCHNTNTTLPYVDLVNEVLEVAVCTFIIQDGKTDPDIDFSTIIPALDAETIPAEFAPRFKNEGIELSKSAIIEIDAKNWQWRIIDGVCQYLLRIRTNDPAHLGDYIEVNTYPHPFPQTTDDSDTLSATPEYLNTKAYNRLATASYPWHLPFNLSFIEMRAYLAHLEASRTRMIEILTWTGEYPGRYDDEIAQDILGLTVQDWELITGADDDAASGWVYWGFAEGTDADTGRQWFEILAEDIPEFLSRSGLTYAELQQLLRARSVNVDNVIQIVFPEPATPEAHFLDSPCDLEDLRLSLPSDPTKRNAFLDRVHRFVRLQRRLGWTIHALDTCLWTLSPDDRIDPAKLRGLGDLKRFRQDLDVPLIELASWWGQVDVWGDGERPSLFDRVFLNAAIDAEQREVFTLNPERTELVRQQPISSLFSAIAAALAISEDDLIILSEFVFGSLSTTRLTLANLSLVYRNVSLSRALSLSTAEYVSLRELTGINPFAGGDTDNTLRFILAVRQVRRSGFNVIELDYLLRHVESAPESLHPTKADMEAFLNALCLGLQEIDLAHMPAPDPDGALTTQALQQITIKDPESDEIRSITEEEVSSAIEIIRGQSSLTIEDKKKSIRTLFVSFIADMDVAESTLIRPDATEADEWESKRGERFVYVLNHLLSHLRQMHSRTFIIQSVAEQFQLETSMAGLLLEQLQTANGDDNILIAFLALRESEVIDLASADASKFLEPVTGFVKLHKAAVLVAKLIIKPDELPFLLASGPSLDWLDLNRLPLEQRSDVAAVASPFAAWSRLVNVYHLRDTLAFREGSVFDFLMRANALDRSTAQDKLIEARDTLLPELSELTGWRLDDLRFLCANIYRVFSSKPQLKFWEEVWLERLQRCFLELKRLGVSAQALWNWATTEINPDLALEVKQAVKAQTEARQWLALAQEMRDQLREQQRHALVAYLVGHRPEFDSANALFGHYLIDVEMDACMLTSRVKQAISSTQLFIQRCLLNLEPDIQISSQQAKQWQTWMKNYRVWEANRLVFLYPENWIEPELRTDTSPFFDDLKNALMQNEVTDDTVEAAYVNYLYKLDEVAQLQIMGMYQEEDAQILHVFGRTRNTPHIYYYRRWEDEAVWTPWEKVDLDIEGNHLLPVVWNRRLHLFWPIFTEKPEENQEIPNAGETGTPPKKFTEVQLAWSEYRSGKWAAKSVTEAVFRTSSIVERLYFRGRPEDGRLNIDMQYQGGLRVGFIFSTQVRNVEFVSTNGLISTAKPENPEWLAIAMPRNSRNSFMTVVDAMHEDRDGLWIPTQPRSSLDYLLPQPTPASVWRKGFDTNRVLREVPSRYMIAFPHQYPAWVFHKNFVYQDEHRSYFVQPSWRGEMPIRLGSEYDGRIIFTRNYRFNIFYHPYASTFIRQLNRYGVDGILDPDINTNEAIQPRQGNETDDFRDRYKPENTRVQRPFPVEDIDFEYDGAYALYNWELFFHIPLLIATRLSQNQRYEEALRWFHYVFDPTDVSVEEHNRLLPSPKRFWQIKPFYQNQDVDGEGRPYSIQILLQLLHYDEKDPDLKLLRDRMRKQINQWCDNPFDPHTIARLRTSAYEKVVVMKYLDTVIGWADQLFRRDTIEAINEAIQLYILAAEILGPKPQRLAVQSAGDQTYNQLQGRVGEFSNAWVELEGIAAATVSDDGASRINDDDLPAFNTLYFCIPTNDKLLDYWDVVADRLFKIRHCQNIEGVVRQLPLFEPPIDPALLVRAAAAGVDLSSVLGDLHAPLPHYRFQYILQKAVEFCGDVRALGSALLSVLEKRDAEAIALLRSSQEIQLLNAQKQIKELQIEEAEEAIEGLQKAKLIVEERRNYYENLLRVDLIPQEKLQLEKLEESSDWQMTAQIINIVGQTLPLIGDFDVGTSGWAGSPVVKWKWGGLNLAAATQATSSAMSLLGALASNASSRASIKAGFSRRVDEWQLQAITATQELDQRDKDIAAAEVRKTIAEKDLKNHEQQIENAKEIETFMRDKFTNRELYDWMISQISALYFQSYQIAYDLAKKAEQAYKYELGLSDSNFIQFGYWDSLKKGLLTGDRLHHDLKRMEAAHLDQNRRELELTKHISLAMLDPVALIQLKETGQCFFNLPEVLFALDHPSHYMRRIKSLSITIPCVTGPYSGVNCTLTLHKHSTRYEPSLSASLEERFSAVQSIATSNAQNDSGLFELNFRDERYLPFECAGVISTWLLELPIEFRQFDYKTISDVILHINYTARDGGSAFRSEVNGQLQTSLNKMVHELAESGTGLLQAFHLRNEFPNEWHRLLHPVGDANPPAVTLSLLEHRFPLMLQSKKITISGFTIFVKIKSGLEGSFIESTLKLSLEKGETASDEALKLDPKWNGLLTAEKKVGDEKESGSLGDWTLAMWYEPDKPEKSSDSPPIAPEAVDDIFLVCHYTIGME